MTEGNIQQLWSLASVVSSILGALGGVWLGHWLSTRIRAQEREKLEIAYYAELERERKVIGGFFKALWEQYCAGEKESYQSEYWGNYEFLESLAIEGIKYGIPLWGGHATLRRYLQLQNSSLNNFLKKHNEITNNLLSEKVSYSEIAGELRFLTAQALFKLISPLAHCVLAIKEKDNFKIYRNFQEAEHIEQICNLTGISYERKEWIQIFKIFNKELP